MGDQINLKWNDFEENLRLAFKDFRTLLNDVVLHCGEQKTVRANRLVLCACSEVFRSMLLSEELSRQTNPMILLWDTDVKELERILDFMYFGEVKVKEDRLTSFLALADRLKVKGLCGKENQSIDEPQQHQQPQQFTFPHHNRNQQQYKHKQQLQHHQQESCQPNKRPFEQVGEPEIVDVEPEITHWNTPKKSRTSPHKSSRQDRLSDTYMVNQLELLDNTDDIKQEYEIPLEPEQLLIEGQTDYYGYAGEGGGRGEGDMTGYDMTDKMEPHVMMDPNLPFQCNFCSKSYKSQGSLQNHRSLYHRDQIKNREKQANVTF